MKGEVIKDFLARLGFEVDDASFKRFNTGLASATRRAAALAVAVQAGAVAVHAAVYKIASAQSALLDLSDATSVSVSDLEELGFVAEVTGSSADKLETSIRNLQRTAAEAILGGGQGLEAFRRLGMNVRDGNGELRDTVDLLFEVGDRIKSMSSGKRAMFMSQLGIDETLVRMLTEDVAGLRDTYRQMYDVAGLSARQAAEQSRGYVEEVKTLKAVLGLLAKSVAMAVIGRMGRDLARLRKAIQTNFKKISGAVLTVIRVLLRLAGAVMTLVLRVGGWIGDLLGWFGRLDKGTQQLIMGAMGFAAAWKFLNLSFLATPIGLIITGLIALVALIDDFMTYMEGGKSLIDWGPWAGTIMEVVAALRPLLSALEMVWAAVKGPLFAAFRWWFDYMSQALGNMVRVVAAFARALVRLFTGDVSGAIQAVMEMFEALWTMIKDAAGMIGDLAGSAWNKLKGWFGDDDEAPARPALTPSPATAAAATNNSSLNASTVIQVDGAASPEATARAVGHEQRRVNADLVRNVKGAAK